MTPFSATALPPASPLFRGRHAELARLKQICQEEVTAYTVIYGGHQNGKTSLLLQLEAALQGNVSVCRIDFHLIKGAAPERAFAFMAKSLPREFSRASLSGGGNRGYQAPSSVARERIQ